MTVQHNAQPAGQRFLKHLAKGVGIVLPAAMGVLFFYCTGGGTPESPLGGPAPAFVHALAQAWLACERWVLLVSGLLLTVGTLAMAGRGNRARLE